MVVDELLNSLSSKFATVSSEIFAKCPYPVKAHELGNEEQIRLLTLLYTVDDMSKRLDSLEATIQANGDSKMSTTKS